MKTKTIIRLYEQLSKIREAKGKAMRIVWTSEAQERKIIDFIERYMTMDEFFEKAVKK